MVQKKDWLIMAVRDTSIDPRLLESARKQFREKGFLGAQLSDICKDAGITTGAIYNRYKGKEELFEAVVKDTVESMNGILEEAKNVDPYKLSDDELIGVWVNTEENTRLWNERLMDMKDGLELLLKCSEGSKYSRYHEQWLEKMSDIDYDYLKALQERNLADKKISRKELHVLVSALWKLYTEPIVHGMSDKEIEHHCKVVGDLFNWQKAIGIKV